jgi:hypothetical protein
MAVFVRIVGTNQTDVLGEGETISPQSNSDLPQSVPVSLVLSCDQLQHSTTAGEILSTAIALTSDRIVFGMPVTCPL